MGRERAGDRRGRAATIPVHPRATRAEFITLGAPIRIENER